MQYTVYYWKDPNIIRQIFLEGINPTPETLLNTHIELGPFEAPNIEDLSPKIINTIQPFHTSIQVGDVVKDGEAAYFIRDIWGYTKI